MRKRTLQLILAFLLGASTVRADPAVGVKVKHNGAVHKVPLETYVAGVLLGEMPSDWPVEALKAQAVAARSYVLYRKQNPRNSHYDVQSTVHDQVYQSREVPSLVREAVSQTKGEVLKKNGRVLPGYFHSCCGGALEDLSVVWGGPAEALARSEDTYCAQCPSAHWSLTVSKEELASLLPSIVTKEDLVWKSRWSLFVRERSVSGRAKTLAFKTETQTAFFSAVNLRAKLGTERLKSTFFDLTEEEEAYRFDGRGFGHGVGLCQWGAKGMAEAGLTYKDILSAYYPEARLEGAAKTGVDEAITVEPTEVIEDLLQRGEEEGALPIQ